MNEERPAPEQMLARLQALVDEPGKPFLAAVWAAYQDFQKLNAPR